MSNNSYKSKFQLFVDVNNLKKKYIAEYLGVSNAFITQLSQGLRDVPSDKLALIKANETWNVSMFNEVESRQPLGGVETSSDQVVMSREVFDLIVSQQETLKSQQRTIEDLNKKY